MPPSENIFPPEPPSFSRARAMRKRGDLAEKRANNYAKKNYVQSLNLWILSYKGFYRGTVFASVKRAKEDVLMSKANKAVRNGRHEIYKYLAFEPFDERIGYTQPTYALPRSSSTTASRDPS
ncbi:MAG: hypothetical protein PHD48_01995 [Alphaproteobacteria bacterium]|nr:hypothetical protein [Alphaproteobacteria bacterium]